MAHKRSAFRAVALIALLCVHLMLPRPALCRLSPSPAFASAGAALSFCGGFTGVGSFCDDVEDAALMEQFQAMNISDAACAAIVKGVLCAVLPVKCNSMELLNSTADPAAMARSVPLLCPSTGGTSTTTISPHQDATSTLCLERIAAGTYQSVAAHPDGGSGRVFLSTQDGMIWPASIPAHGSGGTLQVDDGASPFLNLSNWVLMNVAFHPGFATNGRFFVSYMCDSASTPACGASKCLSASAEGNGSMACRYQLVVAEFSAKGKHDYSKATHAEPYEVKRIFTMGLPKAYASYNNKHDGQILFRPTNGDSKYLYLIVAGHGVDEAKDKRLFYGKIIRFDIDRATPNPDIFAIGLNNPRGCSFGAERSSGLYCTDVDEQEHEKVYLIAQSAAMTTVSVVVDHGRPTGDKAPSIIGGFIYRGSADPSLKGRYLYMYGPTAWVADETPAGSGRYAVARIAAVKCSRSTPMPCHGGIGTRILSMGEDSSNDAILLATDGVYRVVAPGLCGGAPQPPQSAHGWLLSLLVFAVAFAFYLVYSTIFGGGGQILTRCNGCCRFIIMCCVRVNDGPAENPALQLGALRA
ncbi:hypothetical protein ACP70R_033479 [Stipagrostis hirtigluma subsp. patula]